MKKIAHIILEMNFGGAENLVVDLSTWFMNEQYQSFVFCLEGIMANTQRLIARGVRLELVKRRPVVFDLKAAWKLRQAVRHQGIDLIHAHDMSSLLYGLAAGFPSIPVIMTEHSRHYIDARLLRRFEKWLLAQGTSRLVTVSPRLAESAMRRDLVPARKIQVIENGVNIQLFSSADGSSFRQEIGVEPDAILLGMVGRLEEIKGPDVLLDAFGVLAKENPRLRLVYVGEGSLGTSLMQRALEQGIAGSVIFAGARTDIPCVMSALDILVIPSLSEGLPFALLEGMAAGRPVVASSVGFIPNILDDGARGWLVSPGDSGMLASTLRNVTGNLPQARDVAARAGQYVAANYSMDRMMEQYEQVYQTAMAARR